MKLIDPTMERILQKGLDNIDYRDVRILRKHLQRCCYNIFHRELRLGNVERIDTCEICDGAYTEAHHHDYFKPLEVIWLCDSCHGMIHRKDVDLTGTGLEAFKLKLDQHYRVKVKVFDKKGKTITGSVEGDRQLWRARIRHCGRACVNIYNLTNSNPQLETDTVYRVPNCPPSMRNPEQERLNYLAWLDDNRLGMTSRAYNRLKELYSR